MKLLAVKTILLFTLFCFIEMHGECQRKYSVDGPATYETVSFGLGAGLDYGGLGANAIIYPIKNMGIFLGLGYDLLSVGYNVGLKYRFISKNTYAKITPYLLAMYGYNGVIRVSSNNSFGGSYIFNATYTGATFGVGLDTRHTSLKKGYWSFGLLVPVRPGYNSDYDYLKNQGFTFNTPSLPILFTVGYKFVLD